MSRLVYSTLVANEDGMAIKLILVGLAFTHAGQCGGLIAD